MPMKIKYIITTMGVALLLTSCPDEKSESPAIVSKLSLCQKLWGSYCDAAVSFGCDGRDGCGGEKEAACEAAFDGSCGASAEEQEMIDHDIEMIIGSKEDCGGLESIESYEQDKIDELKRSGCDSASASDGDGDSDSDGDADSDGDVDADGDEYTLNPELNITDTCQICVQASCPGMYANFEANPNSTTFINQVCDCACEASDAFMPLFTCIVLSAAENDAEVQAAGADLAACISGSGAPCASACNNFGCECDPGEAIDDCNFCIAESCVEETLTCFGNSDCLTLMDCVSGCDNDGCIDTCGVTYPYGVTDFVYMFACIAGGCAAECDMVD